MRVLLVAHRFPPESVAGVETYTKRLARELVQAGDQVTVVARRWMPAPRPVRERLPDGATLIRFDGGGEAPLTRFLDLHPRGLSGGRRRAADQQRCPGPRRGGDAFPPRRPPPPQFRQSRTARGPKVNVPESTPLFRR